jgi:3-hydroxyacyl-[acyl-carrier-protein] dehydratase
VFDVMVLSVNGCSLRIISSGFPVEAIAVFSADFPGFAGHFPGEPIVPGFCQVELGLEVIGRVMGRVTVLRGIEDGKFTRAIRPGEEIRISGEQRGEGMYGVSLAVRGEPCSRFTLIVEG